MDGHGREKICGDLGHLWWNRRIYNNFESDVLCQVWTVK